MRSNTLVSYIYNQNFIRVCSRGTKIKNRALMVHSLIEAYQLLKHMKIVSPTPATDSELRLFHSVDYVDYLQRVNDAEDVEKAAEGEDAQQFGFGYDCPLMFKQYDYVCAIAGGTLTAAKRLVEQHEQIVINWAGGWHHAKKDEAAGFCYVNDIVLGIVKLLERFQRVLYVDLDAHHGDGVEDAFAYTSKVLTVSLHKYEEGFYPGSGRIQDVGFGRGRFHSVNVPLRDGIRDQPYFQIFSQVLSEVKARYEPDVVVCQCGADGLIGDPIDSFNLTPLGLGQCVTFLLQWKLPTMFLGGGGYNASNTARCWTYLTSLITGCSIDNDIPDNHFLLNYGPGYELSITAGNRCDHNQQHQLDHIADNIKQQLSKLRSFGTQGLDHVTSSAAAASPSDGGSNRKKI